MPRIVALLDPKCDDLKVKVRTELAARYGGEFRIVDADSLIGGDPQEEDIAPAVACWFWIVFAMKRFEAGVYVAVTRRHMEHAGAECDVVMASVSAEKTLLFIIPPQGGGVMQWIEKPRDTYPVPDEDPLGFVFEAIEANDKQQFS